MPHNEGFKIRIVEKLQTNIYVSQNFKIVYKKIYFYFLNTPRTIIVNNNNNKLFIITIIFVIHPV